MDGSTIKRMQSAGPQANSDPCIIPIFDSVEMILLPYIN